MQQQRHVFVSHSSDDRDEANFVASYLEQRGLRIWIAPRNVRPGRDYSEQLQQAIEECGAFLVLVTSRSNKSPYVRVETEMAFSLDKPIFPVRTSDVAPAPGLALFLKIKHWTDAFGAAREQNLARLGEEIQYVVAEADAADAGAPTTPGALGGELPRPDALKAPLAVAPALTLSGQSGLLAGDRRTAALAIGGLAAVALFAMLITAALRTANVGNQSASTPQENRSARAASPAPAAASNTQARTSQNFIFRNASNAIVTHLYVSPVTSNNWGSDVLGASVLPPGQAVQLAFPSSSGACNWDLKLRVEDGTEHEMRNTDLCGTNEVAFQ